MHYTPKWESLVSMAVGDTIAGQVRVLKTVRLGHSKVVLGPLRSVECDQATAANIIVNPVKGRVYAAGEKLVAAPKAVFNPGETLEIQFNAAALAEAATFDSDTFVIDVIEEDLNTGEPRMRTLSVADQELVADFTTIAGTFVTGFLYTVPARTKITMSGLFQAEAEETA